MTGVLVNCGVVVLTEFFVALLAILELFVVTGAVVNCVMVVALLAFLGAIVELFIGMGFFANFGMVSILEPWDFAVVK